MQEYEVGMIIIVCLAIVYFSVAFQPYKPNRKERDLEEKIKHPGRWL